MGFCSKLFKLLAIYSLVLTVIFFVPGILPNIPFEYYEIEPSVTLAPNSILNHATVLVEGGLDGPESIAIRGKDELYTGDRTGKIFRYKDGKLSTVVQLGFPCDQIDVKVCSAPLGMRFDNNGKLVVADMFGGILRIDVDTGSVETLVSRFDLIDGKYPGLTEDVTIGRDGTVYWADGTTSTPPEKMAYSLLGHSRGRLLQYDPVTNKSQVLVEDINFSNGVQLSEDEEFVIVSDFMSMKILRHFLKGKKKGTTDVFADGLPGYPDNIRPNGKGGYYVGIINRRPQAFDAGKYPNLRKLFARVVYLSRYVNRYFYDIFPNVFLKIVDDVLNILGIVPLFISITCEGFFLELNKDGDIIGSLQSSNGKLNMLSQITLGEKYAYLVSPNDVKIWQIERTHLL